MVSLPVDMHWSHRSAMYILVNQFNEQETAISGPPWRKSMACGSPLHVAIHDNNRAAVRLLLRHQADVNQVDSLGRTSLHLAVSCQCSPEILRELLDAGAGPPGLLDDIAQAACDGNLGVIKVLADADPRALRDADRFSADGLLYLAGSVEVFQYLISQGMSPFDVETFVATAVTNKMSEPLFNGYIFNSGLISWSTLESTAGAFTYALDSGNVAFIKKLQRTVPNEFLTTLVNRGNPGWVSPLCVAASKDATKLAETLVAMGANIDSEGCPYGSPLMAACALGSLEMVKYLVRSGAELLYVNEGLPRSAVRLSCRHQNILRWLLIDRHLEQPKLEYQPSQSISHKPAWSGPRLFKLALPAHMHRDFGESRWGHLQRLQKWKRELFGSTLAGTRKHSGLDFNAEVEFELRKSRAQAAHRELLARLGEV